MTKVRILVEYFVESSLKSASLYCIVIYLPTEAIHDNGLERHVMPTNIFTQKDETTHENQTYILGSGPVGVAVARRLRANGHTVRVIDDSIELSEVPAERGDPTNVDLLADVGVDNASTVVVATRSDRRNLLVAQLVSTHFDVPRTIVLANEPPRLSLFEAAGHEPVCATTVLSEALLEEV